VSVAGRRRPWEIAPNADYERFVAGPAGSVAVCRSFCSVCVG